MTKDAPVHRVGQVPFSPGQCGFAVQWHPFIPGKLACASGSQFGLSGRGKLTVMDVSLSPTMTVPGTSPLHERLVPQSPKMIHHFDSVDVLYDLAWSETDPDRIATACGDGSWQMWDLKVPMQPMQHWPRAHAKEVSSICWGLLDKSLIVTCSWDQTIKVWQPERERMPLKTFVGHEYCVYKCIWSPHTPGLLASASGDHTVRFWDLRSPADYATQIIRAHEQEVLALDWFKYTPHLLVSGSVDRTMRIWDTRRSDKPLQIINAHQMPVRQVQCSPHFPLVVASTSYDMTMRVWDLRADVAPASDALDLAMLIHEMDQHSEFILDVDWNLHLRGMLATCSWDQHLAAFMVPRLVHK